MHCSFLSALLAASVALSAVGDCQASNCPDYPCPAVVCPRGSRPTIHRGECCPRCPVPTVTLPTLTLPTREPPTLDCRLVRCARPPCPTPLPPPPGRCCPFCRQDCRLVRCARPPCPIPLPPPPGKCCPFCRQDCRVVLCARPPCPIPLPPPPGECCQTCPPPTLPTLTPPTTEPPTLDCRLVDCAIPPCPIPLPPPPGRCCPFCRQDCRVTLCLRPPCDNPLPPPPGECCSTCPPPTRPPPPVCPRIPPGTGGICVEECSGDDDCDEGEKCCFNGCGHTCTDPIPPTTPPPSNGSCLFNGVEYPVGATFPAGDGCNRCSCIAPGRVVCTLIACPPPTTPPPGNSTCVFNGMEFPVGATFPAGDGCNTCRCGPAGFVACTEIACPPTTRPPTTRPPTTRPPPDLTCPPVFPGTIGICIFACRDNDDCDDGEKCCFNGCGKVCTDPIPVPPPSPRCPPDKPTVNCFVDPCRFATCPAHPDAVCVSDFCGGCNARFFNRKGREVTNTCDLPTISPTTPPPTTRPPTTRPPTTRPPPDLTCPPVFPGTIGICVIRCRNDNDCNEGEKCCFNGCGQVCTDPVPVPPPSPPCPPDRPPVLCFVDPCEVSSCPAHPDAVCVSDQCGGCNARFFDRMGREVTSTCKCPVRGQVFTPCGSACVVNCTTPVVPCTLQCVPRCQCPRGQVIDEDRNKCVPLNQCSNRRCPIPGQVFQQCRPCPATCQNPDIVCAAVCVPGCGCPPGQLVDEARGRCVARADCPDICSLPPDPGPCRAFFPSFFFNSTSRRCERFIYGGCRGNANRFRTLAECNRRCSRPNAPPRCPPTCSVQFCRRNRRALCTVPGPREIPGCTGECQVTSCRACYFAREPRRLPGNCSTCGFPVQNLNCLKRWGFCVYVAHWVKYDKPPHRDRTTENFRCFRYPCPLRG